ncbi:MAG: 4Fe-4S dicluster domain-containing protein [Candidatus Eisenbacteria bacterium]|nr:4Fe-4S dicluster domain-containing protein [Candidatus Eisenbacteria bacterium]
MAGPGTELSARAELAAKCRSCGTCRSVCPVFAEVGTEGSVARGKVALIRSVLDGELELSEIFEDRVLLCLNCKACVANCPNDVRVDDLILAARHDLVESGRLPLLRRLIFRLLLKRGRLLPPFGRLASFVQRRVLRGLPPGSPLRILLPLAGIDEHRVFPEFAPRSFMSEAPREVAASGVSEGPAAHSGPGVQVPSSGDASLAGSDGPSRDAGLGVQELSSGEAALAGSGGPSHDAGPSVPGRPSDDVSERTAARSSEGSPERGRIAREARRVAYFVGCATNQIYPESGRATVDALSRSGVDVVIPRGQICCGTPVFNSGDYETARAMARRNARVLRETGADAVVTGCASCGLSLKREYEETLGLEGGVGIPVFDLSEFLAHRNTARLLAASLHEEHVPPEPASSAQPLPSASAPGGDRPSSESTNREKRCVRGAGDPAKLRVTFHDPCHLVRGQEIVEAPRDILRALPWVEFVEMRDADRCCGGGGTFSLSHYDISKKIGERKVAAIREADVDVVATECPACVMQLQDMATQWGLDVEVMSLADLLALGPGRAAD